MVDFSELNKRGGSNKVCSWENFLKKNKKTPLLIRDFRVGFYLKGNRFKGIHFYLGVVQKLRGHDEVGRWSKNVIFFPHSV